MYEHLLVPVDDSDLSRKAMRTSIDLARMLGARITALTVELPLPMPLMSGEAAGVMPFQAQAFADHQTRSEIHARALLKAFGEMSLADGVAFDGQFVFSDEVAQVIVDVAQKQACDLMVMGTHGRHGLDALINGSLTKSVLSHSQIPLLIIH